MIPLALAAGFLRKHWPALAVAAAFAVLLALVFGLRVQAKHYRAQRDEARAALAYAEAIGKQQAERTVAAEKAAHDALEAARAVRETAYADVDRWQRVAADRARGVRVCVDPGPRTGPVPGAAGAGSGNDAAGTVADVPREVGPDLVALAADADRVAARLEQCQAYVRGLPSGF